MTLPGGGRTLTVTAAASLLTEYAPIRIINLSTQRIWVADNSGVSSQNGVPVDPGTSLPWSAPGSIYGVLDPAATGNATIVLTNAIAGWEPSPATIAAQIVSSTLAIDVATQVAAKLLAGGVPNVLTETQIVNGQPISGGTPAYFDVHGYASVRIVVTFDNQATAGGAIGYQFQETNAGWLVNGTAPDQATIYPVSPFKTEAVAPVVAVAGTYLAIQALTTGANKAYVTIYGSNRIAPNTQRASALGYSSVGFQASTGSVAMLANTSYPINALVAGEFFQGPAYAMLEVTGSTVKGQFVAQVQDGVTASVLTYLLTDTSETGWRTPGGNQYFTKMITLPNVLYQLAFVCTTAGTATVTFNALPNY